MSVEPPFSKREQPPKAWIANDLPDTARIAIMHLLHDLIDKGYIDSWIDLDKELSRIARKSPRTYDRQSVPHIRQAKESAELIVAEIRWEKALDFCERLYTNLAKEVWQWITENDREITTTMEEVRLFISDEIERIFLEENLGYSFVNGEVRIRGRGHTRKQAGRAEPTLGDSRLKQSRQHYAKALKYFDNPTQPDYENAFKEAVCAVEAAARSLHPFSKGKTLGEIIKNITGNQEGQLPKPLADSITGLYGFRNSGEGVSHGGSKGGRVTKGFAEYALALAASQIILLHEMAVEGTGDVPY